jgi:hypothetical protein
LPGIALAPCAGMETIRRAIGRSLDGKTTCLCLVILLLNLLDAFATLRHLEHGAHELNPFMQALLNRSANHFLVVKHLLASAGVIGIVVNAEQRATQVALFVLLPLYSMLALYQIALFYVT